MSPDLAKAIIKARFYECDYYIRQSDTKWCFYKRPGWLKVTASVWPEPWMPKPYEKRTLQSLRDKYDQHKRNSRIGKRED